MYSLEGLHFRLKEKRKSSSPRKRRARKTSGGDRSNERPNSPEAAANADVPPGGDAQTSPDSCPICLCRLDNKSFTDSCFHTFCFVCLQEWSKVKPVCPLCKQKFQSIIHNVRSLDDYDQYYIQQNPPPCNYSANIEFDRRFRYRTTLTNDHTYDPWMMRQNHEHDRQLALLQRPSRTRSTARGHWRRLRQTATSAFRKRIYAQNMRVQSIRTGSGRAPRYRDVTPEFFSRNTACTHRLVPWLNRELNVILRGDEHTNFILELIIDLVKRFEIQSAEFREHIYPFIGERTDLFIHEFYNFARSPYDMVAYDQHAVYDEPTVTVETDSDRTSAAEQDEIVVVSPPEPLRREPSASLGAPNTASLSTDPLSLSTTDYSGQSRSGSFSIRLQELLVDAFSGDTANSGWESPIPGPSSSVMWSPPIPTTPPRLPSTSVESLSVYSLASFITAAASTSETTVTVADTFSSSDSESDIEIIGYEKPFEQRTPIAILSDSDPDFNIIDLENQSSHKAKKKSKKKKKKKSKDRSPEHRRRKEDKNRRDRSRSKSRSREKRRREHSTDAYSDGSRSSPKRDRRDTDRYREKERHTEYLRKLKSYHRGDERRSEKRRLSSNIRHSDKDRHDGTSRRGQLRSCYFEETRRRDRSRSRSHERVKSKGKRNNMSETSTISQRRRSRSRSSSPSFSIDPEILNRKGKRRSKAKSESRSRSSSPSFSIDHEILRRHKNGVKSKKSKRKSRSPSFDLDLNFDMIGSDSSDQHKSKRSKRKSRTPSSERDTDFRISRSEPSGLRPILKRRTSDRRQETNVVGEEQVEAGHMQSSSAFESQGRFWSPKVKFQKLQSTSNSPSPRHGFHDLCDASHSPSVEGMAQESISSEGMRVWDRLGPEHDKVRQETCEQTGSIATKSRSRSRSSEGKEKTSKDRENSSREEPKQSPKSCKSVPSNYRVARKRVPEGYQWSSESESESERREVTSRGEGKKNSTTYRSQSESESSDCKMYSDSSSPEKSRSRNINSEVRRKSRSRSRPSESSSSQARSVASVIRVKSRSRSRSSDCQFFISRSKYRGHDSDIEFIVAKPAKRHKRHKHHKKHKKRRYYVIEDSDSDGNQEIEILDVVPTKHKKKSKESNAEGKKYKKHHTGHKKSSKNKSSSAGGETLQEQNNANSRRAERATSTDSVELVGVDNRNVPPFIGAEIDILIPELILPQDEPINLTQRRPASPQVLSESPDELHRKCEVSSSSADLPDLESILKPCKFDPLSIAGEVVAYPLHGQERGRGDGRKEGSDGDKDGRKREPLPPVRETIASITDTVERELAKKRDRDRETETATASQGPAPSRENGRQQEEVLRTTNPAYEDGESLSHLNRPPFVMEWLSSTSNGATACASSSSGTPQSIERKRPSTDPIMSSVAFKSPRVSDSETMETGKDTMTTGPVPMATSSGDESLPSGHHPMEASMGIEIHVTQSDVAMETGDLPTISKEESQVETTGGKSGDSEQHGEHGESLPKQTTEGFGLLPPSCDPRNRSPSKDPVLFPISMSSDAMESKTTTTDDKSEQSTAAETTEQTISTIVQAVEKELSSRRSSQSEDSSTECTASEDIMEQKSREIASVSGDRPKTPPPLAMDNMFSLGSNTDSDEDDNNRSTQSPVDPNLYELVGQMRRSPSRSASMILLASMNAQKIFNAPVTSPDEPSNDSPEKDFVPHSEEEKLEFEEALPSTQESLADISDIVGDLSKPSTSSSRARLEVEKQRMDRIMSLTKMDLFEPESTSSVGVHEGSDNGVDTVAAVDQSQSTESPSVAPSLVTDLLQKDIQTNNGSSSEDLTSLEKQMRKKITARLEQKDLLPPSNKDE